MKILLKNGTIYDGTGSAPYVGDVLFEDNRIFKVGKNLAAADGRVIDVEGLAVCPGLIDAHSHNDFFYDRPDAEKYYRPFIEQGITPQITGNCSFSPFGVDPDTPYREKIGGGLFDALHPCSFAEFKDRAKGRLFVNLVPLIGQGSVRAGIAGYDPAPFTKEKIVRKMTGATADRYEIPERGYLKPGFKADVTVLDINALRVDESKPDFRPTGIAHVFINGQPVMENGIYVSGQAGEVVLKH